MFQRTLLQNKQTAGGHAAAPQEALMQHPSPDKAPIAKLPLALHWYGEKVGFCCLGQSNHLLKHTRTAVGISRYFQQQECSCVPLSCSLLAGSGNGLVQCSADTNTWQSPDTGFNTCNVALVKPDKAILLSLLGSTASGKTDRTPRRPGESGQRSAQPLAGQFQGCPAAEVLAHVKC